MGGWGEHILHPQFHIIERDDFLILCAFLGTAPEGRGFYHITSVNVENDWETT